MFALLAFIAFTVACVLACIRHGWETALIAAGLALLTWPHIHV